MQVLYHHSPCNPAAPAPPVGWPPQRHPSTIKSAEPPLNRPFRRVRTLWNQSVESSLESPVFNLILPLLDSSYIRPPSLPPLQTDTLPPLAAVRVIARTTSVRNGKEGPPKDQLR